MILMYHHVAPLEKVPADRNRDGWNLTVSPDALRRHIRTLQSRGQRFISMDEMVSLVETRGFAGPGSVVLTLDDGWLDNYEFALPVFVELKVPAAFFVTTNHLRGAGEDTRRMTALHLREALAAGMTIGAHSRSHPTLSRLDEAAARDEIRGSKQDLEDTLGTEVAHFAYPGGDFNRRTADITREAGYRSACSVVGLGVNTRATLFWLHREVLTEAMDSWRDRCSLSFAARLALTPRARRSIHACLHPSAVPQTP